MAQTKHPEKNESLQIAGETGALPPTVSRLGWKKIALLSTLAASVAAPGMLASPAHAGDTRRKRPPKRKLMAAPVTTFDFDMGAVEGNLVSPGATMGATPGGAQDIGYARDRIAAGEVPHPNAFTPEGLFSEHNLPLANQAPCRQRLCVGGGATPVNLVAQPEVHHLAQLGFSSNLTANFRRPPLSLVVVVDRSGSMSGKPLELVRSSLKEVLGHLRPGDKIGIVGYHSTAHVVLPPTPVGQRAAIVKAIDSLHSEGATALEDGLRLGFSEARKAAKGFAGTSRVMLFTDERPNVGNTKAAGFMHMAHQASRAGIGLTTIGVATHFGAELAQKVSSVRGGNLFFFPDETRMQAKFRDEFDTLVTELAYDLNLRVAPAPGMKIAGVYGIPGKAIKWQGNTLEMTVSTIFLSKRKGAIFVAFAPESGKSLPARMPTAGASV
ncbi:MAG: vWA domain-containing protein, partial [Nannocystaceae bacterium]